ncbi:MAG: hypothetical protein AAGF88_03160 [Pseudomonadota bacterium]
MKKQHVKLAKWGSAGAFFAAADAALGVGAVSALAALCLTDPTDYVELPTMPMEHSRHAIPWVIGGLALASTAFVGNWRIAQVASKSPWAPSRRPILAALVLIARDAQTLEAEDICAAWNATMTPEIDIDDARIALSRFSDLPDAERLRLLCSLTDASRRGLFICAALRLVRAGRGAGLPMLERIAAEMRLAGPEIAAHWDTAHAPQFAESFEKKRAAILRTCAEKGRELRLSMPAAATRWYPRIGASILRRAFLPMRNGARALTDPDGALADRILYALETGYRRLSHLVLSRIRSAPLPFNRQDIA